MYEFNYHRPGSLNDASGLLSGAGDAKIIAGGQTLIPTLKQRLAQPSDVIDLGAMTDLVGICEEAGAVVIGAMTPHAAVAGSDLLAAEIPALARLAGGIGDPQVRHRGTLGGSVANNDPAADYPAAVLGLGATVKTTRRDIAADDYFTGLFDTALAEDEIITAVSFPVPEKAAYVKFDQPASRYALVGVFVAKTAGGVRVAVTGAGDSGVFRSSALEAALSADFSAEAAENTAVPAQGLLGDLHGTPGYRAHLIKVMAKRAVDAVG